LQSHISHINKLQNMIHETESIFEHYPVLKTELAHVYIVTLMLICVIYLLPLNINI